MKLMKLAIFTLMAGVAQSCSKEEYAAKFGATYELLAAPAPSVIQGNKLVASVRYLSKCNNGGSVFEAVAKDLTTTQEMNFDVVLLSRKEPRCSNPGMFEVSYTEQVTVPLPTFPKTKGFVGKDLMIAFPPDGAYEIYKLQNAGQRSNVPLVEAATPRQHKQTMQEVQEELDTQTTEDSIAFLHHCETSETPTTCCTPMMVQALKEKIREESAVLPSTTSPNATKQEDRPGLFDAAASATADVFTSIGNSEL
jgi:hypothetical protein